MPGTFLAPGKNVAVLLLAASLLAYEWDLAAGKKDKKTQPSRGADDFTYGSPYDTRGRSILDAARNELPRIPQYSKIPSTSAGKSHRPRIHERELTPDEQEDEEKEEKVSHQDWYEWTQRWKEKSVRI